MGRIIESVGYPDFWDVAHDVNPKAFKAIHDLLPLQEKLFTTAVSEPLHKTLRHIAKTQYNAMGAILLLVMNGYGNDTMKVARGMFEAAVTIAYLRKYPEKLEDFLDYELVRRKKLLDYMVRHEPELAKGVDPGTMKSIVYEFEKVKSRFVDRRGRVQSSWSKVPLAQRAADVGLAKLYDTFYSWASSIHHVDISGLTAQVAENDVDPDVAPSKKWLREALVTAHMCILRILGEYTEAVMPPMKTEVDKAIAAFQEAWNPPGWTGLNPETGS